MNGSRENNSYELKKKINTLELKIKEYESLIQNQTQKKNENNKKIHKEMKIKDRALRVLERNNKLLQQDFDILMKHNQELKVYIDEMTRRFNHNKDVYERSLQQKNAEILDLRNQIQMKEQELQRKEQEISYYQERIVNYELRASRNSTNLGNQNPTQNIIDVPIR